MSNTGSGSRFQTLLVFLVGLLAGGIGGYAIGTFTGAGSPGTTTASLHLDDQISSENAWIVEGLSCPMPGCTNALLTCDGELSRRIRDWVNAQLQAGRPGQQIRDEIIRTHGSNVLKFGGHPAVNDTLPAGL